MTGEVEKEIICPHHKLDCGLVVGCKKHLDYPNAVCPRKPLKYQSLWDGEPV